MIKNKTNQIKCTRQCVEKILAEKIVKNKSALQFLKPWDIAVFRGGPDGLLHRTPDAALNNPSILMRLDNLSFLEALKIVQ